MTEEPNPYASPAADLTPAILTDTDLARAEDIRRHHLNHEASVKALGWLHLIGGTIAFCGLVVLALNVARPGVLGLGTRQPARQSKPLDSSQTPLAVLPGPVEIGLQLLVSLLAIWIGFGMRKLHRRVRIPAGVFYALGLLAFPIGTIINGYFLYLVFSSKGAMVFSLEYQRIIEQTPHVKHKTSIVVWILLFVLLAVLAMLILGSVMGLL